MKADLSRELTKERYFELSAVMIIAHIILEDLVQPLIQVSSEPVHWPIFMDLLNDICYVIEIWFDKLGVYK